MKNKASLSYLNRNYSEITKLLHQKNNLGTKLSETTKLKMSKSSGGVTIKLTDVSSNDSIIFKNKSSLAKELNISLRTVK